MTARIIRDGSVTRVYLDGTEVHKVVSYKLTESITDRPTLLLELAVDELEVDVEAEVTTKTLKDKKNEEGYKDFVRFLFGSLK